MTRTSVHPETGYADGSKWLDLDDGPVHYIDHGGPEGAPLLVLVHGLGGSHANWSALAPLLTGSCRVLAVDLAGFGLTPGGRARSAGVRGNQDLLDRFLAAVSDTPAVLVGNSMGGMVSLLETAAVPERVRGLALLDPVLPLAAAVPDRLVAAAFLEDALPAPVRAALARRRGPVTTDRTAMHLVTLCCDDPARVNADVVQIHLELAQRRGFVEDSATDFMAAGRSMVFTFLRRRRYARLLSSITTPVLLIHGTRDRLVPFRVAQVAAGLNPSWTFAPATGVGHAPMLEAPGWTRDRILEWLATLT